MCLRGTSNRLLLVKCYFLDNCSIVIQFHSNTTVSYHIMLAFVESFHVDVPFYLGVMDRRARTPPSCHSVLDEAAAPARQQQDSR